MAWASELPAGQCTTKNVVYQITREECEQYCFDDAGKYLVQRVAEHACGARNKFKNSHWGVHCPNFHDID